MTIRCYITASSTRTSHRRPPTLPRSTWCPGHSTTCGKRYTAFRVNQWSVVSKPEDFQPLQNLLDTSGAGIEVYSGSDGQQCGWLALRDSDQRGLFTGWEFDGRDQDDGPPGWFEGLRTVQFDHARSESPRGIPTPSSRCPVAFIGLFHGDWDEAGYRTQRFVESVLAKPAPESKSFPYVSWDSWAYQDKIDEQTLRRNAEHCRRSRRPVVHRRSGMGARHRRTGMRIQSNSPTASAH